MKQYRERVVDSVLRRKLAGTGAVLVEGAKWCGKTTTAEQVARSAVYMADPKKRKSNIELASLLPERILAGESPRLIDEWQIAPALWDAIRHEVDHVEGLGQFILTGSAVPPDNDEMKHSGTGRFAWLTMRPMSLWESGESSGEVSLGSLFADGNLQPAVPKELDLRQIAFAVCRGGWPQAVSLSGTTALDQARNYVDAVAKRDLSRADGVERDEDRVRRFLRSYARIQATQASATVIRQDLMANEMAAFDSDTVYAYHKALKKIFVIEDMPAWNPNLRSKPSMRVTDTRYFTDPSIAAAALEIGPDDLLDDLATFGFLFETMAVRDLRVYMDAEGGLVRHYRDKQGLECDAVLHRRNGDYALVEIKLGGDALISEGAATLRRLSDLIDSKKVRKPSFKMVLTAVGGIAYRRKEDGIFVCPVTALRP